MYLRKYPLRQAVNVYTFKPMEAAHNATQGRKKMTKTYKISELFLIEFAKTGSVKLAFEAVFGEGSFDQFAGDMYEALRASK